MFGEGRRIYFHVLLLYALKFNLCFKEVKAHRAGSDGSMSALVQQVWGSIPGGVVNFNWKIFNLGARRGGDVHFLIARLYSTVLD